jgi:quercetin dioxygenase-like cupin family protein
MQSVNLISDARYSDDKATVLHAVKTDQLVIDGLYMKAGQTTGWSKNPDADRAILCVSGSGELVLETAAAGNELRISLTPGAVVLAPRGTFHQVVGGSQGMVASIISKFPVRVIERG